MSRLEVRDLVVGYDAADVLRSVSLDVPDGSLLAIVGPSGCGKTTLLRTIAGLVRARAGEIRIGTRMVTTHGIHLAPEKRRIGWVPQDAALFPHLTVAENIAFGLPSARGSARSARRAATGDDVQRLLALVGLGTLGDRLPAQLSGGQAQRVALARALYGDPALIILDEPNAFLDSDGEEALLRAITTARARKATVLLIAHRKGILQSADRLLVLEGGRPRMFGPAREVVARLAGPESTESAA